MFVTKNPYRVIITKEDETLTINIYDPENQPCISPNLFLEHLSKTRGYSFSTIRVTAFMLAQFFWYCLLKEFNYSELKDFKSRFEDFFIEFILWMEKNRKKSPQRIKKIIQVVLWFYRYHFLKTGNDALLIYIDSILEKYKRPNIFIDEFGKLPNYREIKDEDLALLLKMANNLRDKLILHLICVVGLLPKEVQRLRWIDLRPSENHLIINGPPTKIFIKSGYRIVVASKEVFDLLDKYKNELQNNNRFASEYIFVSRVGLPKPITYDGIMSFLRLLSKQSGLDLSFVGSFGKSKNIEVKNVG